MRHRLWSGSGARTTVTVVVTTVGLVGCAAKVRQDVFDQTIDAIRADMAEMDGQVDDNTRRIVENERALGELRGDLEALAADFDELQTALSETEDGLRFAMPIHFDFDQAEIRPDDRPLLDRFARVIAGYYPAALVTVEGFADPAGSQEYNLRLSERRARNVADFLIQEKALDAAGVRIAAYGEDRLAVPGAQGPGPEGLENRRVTFVIEMVGPIDRRVATAGDGAS